MRHLTMLVGLVFALLLTGANAFAAKTWLPPFDPDVHFYVEDDMKNPVTLSDNFKQELLEKARAQGLNPYVVVMQPGDELASTPAAKWAQNTLKNRLVSLWQLTPGFDAEHIEIIVYMREADTMLGSLGVHAGTYMDKLGMRGHVLDSIAQAGQPFMRLNPQAGLLAIQDSIDTVVKNGGVSNVGFWTVLFIIMLILGLVALALTSPRRGGSGYYGGNSSTTYYTSSSFSSGSGSSDTSSSDGGCDA